MRPVTSYAGQTQQEHIKVPAPIAYKYLELEEGPWVMPPYAMLFPGAPVVFQQPGRAKPSRTKASVPIVRGMLQPVKPRRIGERLRGIPIPKAVYAPRAPRRMGSKLLHK